MWAAFYVNFKHSAIVLKHYDFMPRSPKEFLLTFSPADFSNLSCWFILLKKNFLLHNFDLTYSVFFKCRQKKPSGTFWNVQHNSENYECFKEPVPNPIYWKYFIRWVTLNKLWAASQGQTIIYIFLPVIFVSPGNMRDVVGSPSLEMLKK